METTGLSIWAGYAGILVASSAVEVRRTVAERAHMKVVVRTRGRDARVADWLTKVFQAIIVSPSVVGVDTVMVASGMRRCPRAIDPIAERLRLGDLPSQMAL
jgi:hypothetical protein